ncbi:acyltransferase family protein [uncultured Muribaculum sp.]|uniref:acyltransferase family protein n=1 Tax=uncultured Muribaculum sp. TaxID=1918613 RepID=UPI00267066BC|nr:heparan-alpha-glucosaminide N-acetyltransferase domain-containing protein [uncultured Muribaculum sp.]
MLNTDKTVIKPGSKRLLSLDVMRGLTIVGMIIVNNAGGPDSYAFLQHSAWNGLTPCDLVFPFFLFIMGVTTYLSLSKLDFSPSWPVLRKILKRTFIILLIGWAIHWFDNGCSGKGWLDFSRLRITGVLTRIALCYGIVSVLALYLSRRAMLWLGAVLLVLYSAALCMWNGYVYDASNFNSVVDRALLGAGHLYTKKPVDPEGLAGTVSAVAHTILGFCCGAMVKSRRPLENRVILLFVIGFLAMSAGFLISEAFPINKRVWSPSFVLVTCGLASLLLATLIYFIDMRGFRRWSVFFEAFGVNPLFLYVMSEVAAIVFGCYGIKVAIYSAISGIVPDAYLASAVYSVAFMLLMGVIGYPLYKKHIYIKI